MQEAWGKGQATYAASKDAQTTRNEEEFALSMEQRRSDAALKGAQIRSSREECVRGMEQRSNDAAVCIPNP